MRESGNESDPDTSCEDAVRQMPLAFPAFTPSYAQADFAVSECNRDAVSALEIWAAGRCGRALALVGPQGAGKTHLAHVFADRIDARIRPVEDAGVAAAEHRAGRPVVVEDAHRADRACAERVMNLLSASQHPNAPLVLITGREEPRAWDGGLVDARTRLAALTHAEIGLPDDALFPALLRKLFRDQQTPVAEPAIVFATARLRRSYAGAAAFVDAARRASLASGRAVSRDLAHKVIARAGAADAAPGGVSLVGAIE